MAVCVGLFVQNLESALDLLNQGLDFVGVRLDNVQPASNGRGTCWMDCGASFMPLGACFDTLDAQSRCGYADLAFPFNLAARGRDSLFYEATVEASNTLQGYRQKKCGCCVVRPSLSCCVWLA